MTYEQQIKSTHTKLRTLESKASALQIKMDELRDEWESLAQDLYELGEPPLGYGFDDVLA